MPTTIRLKGDLESRIKRLAEQTGRPQSYYINQMIEREIDRVEWEYSILHDAEEIRAGRVDTVTHEQLKAELDLED